MIYSEKESKRFNLSIYRHVVDGPLNKKDFDQLLEEKPDILILRLPSEHYAQFNRDLGRDHWLFVGDQVSYLEFSYEDKAVFSNLKTLEGFTFAKLNENHHEGILSLAAREFAGLANHYFANPLIETSLVSDGYAEWCQTLLSQSNIDGIVCLDDKRVVGFIVATKSGDSFDIILNAVDKSFGGRGIYSLMLHNFLVSSREQAEKILISTQSHNYAIQRATSKVGFRLRKMMTTIHCNLMLKNGMQDK